MKLANTRNCGSGSSCCVFEWWSVFGIVVVVEEQRSLASPRAEEFPVRRVSKALHRFCLLNANAFTDSEAAFRLTLSGSRQMISRHRFTSDTANHSGNREP